ncbi:glycosyltransferase family 4 protein [Paenibacillus dendritiformis]|uniref:glycosyltransferase family 4 protein n=1 Tax=Paenibacillus dendritiformis TaxID=130049 RepID=UPI00248AF7A4|nr:glycosyltransferase family 4 protein [Paenibacillus dendritiformis]WGU93812.1 glycosyltransferase family 4 protein [Paenibacillus dendritiformis]
MRKKIAICHAQVPFVQGGAELLIQSLHRELKKRHYDVEIVSLPFKWYPNPSLIQSMMNWRSVDLSESNGEKIDLVIGTKFPSYGVQHPNKVTWLIHQFRQVYDLYGTPYSDFTAMPEDQAVKEFIYRFDNKCLREAGKLFTIAQNTASRLKKYNNIQAEVLYHPPKHVGHYYNNEYGDYILSVGRLDALKRNDVLIETMRYTDKAIKCIIVGRGPEEMKLKSLVSKYNLSDRVFFKGFVEDEDLLKLYANCLSVFYAPFDEDYGYITLEAFLSSKPVITLNDSGGVLEFVRDKESGFIVGDAESAGNRLTYLFNNKKVAAEQGMCGKNIVSDITWDNVIDRLTETIR